MLESQLSGPISQKIFRNRKIWEHFFLLLFYPLQLCHWTFSLKINIDELFFFFFAFWDSFFFMGLEKVYLVRRRIFKTINSVNIGRIYTKKRAVWLEFYQQCIGLINSPLALNAAKLCYSKHAFSEKNPLFTLFFRFFLDFALSEAIFKTLKNAGNWAEVGKNCSKRSSTCPTSKSVPVPGGSLVVMTSK